MGVATAAPLYSKTMSITQTIINASTPFPKGIQPTAWIIPWINTNITFSATAKNEITKLIPDQLWYPTITATKFGLNAGHTAVVSETKPTAYKHSFTAIKSLMSAADRKALDEMDAIMVIVRKNRGGYAVYGAQNGLWKSSQAQMANDNAAMVTATYESRTDMEEEYEEYTINFGTGQTDDIVELMLSVREAVGEDPGIISFNTTSGFLISDLNGKVVTIAGIDVIDYHFVASALILDVANFSGTIYIFPLTGQDISYVPQ